MYDMHFVSTMNHAYDKDKFALMNMMEEVFKHGTDFQKAYCSGLEDFMFIGLTHEHVTLPELAKPSIVPIDAKPLPEFLKYNVWISKVGYL